MPWKLGKKTKKGWQILVKRPNGWRVSGHSSSKRKAQSSIRARYAHYHT